MKKDNNTHIFLEKDDEKYLMINIRLADDNSLYLNFPGKNNSRKIYGISSKKYENFSNDVVFEEYEKQNEDIKVSFHPRDMIVHVNSNVTGRVSEDYHLINESNILGTFAFNIFHILLPDDINFYRKYTKTKNNNCVTIISDRIKSKNIYFEIIVHSNKIVPEYSCFKSGNVIQSWSFDSTTETSYSIGVSEYDNDIEEDSIYALLNTKDEALMYKIK